MILFRLNLWRTVWTKIHESCFKLIFKEKPPGVFFIFKKYLNDFEKSISEVSGRKRQKISYFFTKNEFSQDLRVFLRLALVQILP